MTVQIGAEISSVDLSVLLHLNQTDVIRQALVQWKVIFFRDRNLDHRQYDRQIIVFGQTGILILLLRSDHQFMITEGGKDAEEYNAKVNQNLLVAEYPEAGEHSLYTNSEFVKSIVGLNPRADNGYPSIICVVH